MQETLPTEAEQAGLALSSARLMPSMRGSTGSMKRVRERRESSSIRQPLLRRYAILDAIKMLACPVIEVPSRHPPARGGVRSKSILTQVVTGIVSGLGVKGYPLAVRHIARRWVRLHNAMAISALDAHARYKAASASSRSDQLCDAAQLPRPADVGRCAAR